VCAEVGVWLQASRTQLEGAGAERRPSESVVARKAVGSQPCLSDRLGEFTVNSTAIRAHGLLWRLSRIWAEPSAQW